MNNKSKTKKNKLIIDVYEQPVYIPNKVYVMKNYKQEDIDKLFEYDDGTQIDLNNIDMFKALTVSGCVEKKTGNYCILILLTEEAIRDFKLDMPYAIGVCAHEAFHAAHRILSWCHINLAEESEESYAFLTGWVTSCVFKTLKK